MIAIALLVLLTQAVGTPLDLIAVAQALTPMALPVLVGLAVAATCLHRHAMGFASAIVGCGYLALIAPLVFAGSGPEPAGGEPTVSIVAANLLYRNDQIDAAADMLHTIDADVLALSEVTPDIAAALQRHPLADQYPFRVDASAPLASGLMIWSRLPLGPVGEQPDFRRAIDTTVLTDAGAIRLLLVHPPPPVFDRAQWTAELDSIAGVVDETLFPTVVLGDFNASYFHPSYRRMLGDADLHDVLVDQGRAFTPTWPTDSRLPPFAPLDHVLLDPSLSTLAVTVSEVPGSDHRAVIATVTFAALG